MKCHKCACVCAPKHHKTTHVNNNTVTFPEVLPNLSVWVAICPQTNHGNAKTTTSTELIQMCVCLCIKTTHGNNYTTTFTKALPDVRAWAPKCHNTTYENITKLYKSLAKSRYVSSEFQDVMTLPLETSTQYLLLGMCESRYILRTRTRDTAKEKQTRKRTTWKVKKQTRHHKGPTEFINQASGRKACQVGGWGPQKSHSWLATPTPNQKYGHSTEQGMWPREHWLALTQAVCKKERPWRWLTRE